MKIWNVQLLRLDHKLIIENSCTWSVLGHEKSTGCFGGIKHCKFQYNVQSFPLYTGIVWIGNVAGHVVTLETKKNTQSKTQKTLFQGIARECFLAWERSRDINGVLWLQCQFLSTKFIRLPGGNLATKNCKNVSSKSLLSKIFPPSRGDSKRS